MEWINVLEKMPPPNVPVLAFVSDFCGVVGKVRRIRAMYAPPKTLELHIDAEGGDYDEETDTYWCEEGWYEANVYEECHWRVCDHVTHWMLLPEAPNTGD